MLERNLYRFSGVVDSRAKMEASIIYFSSELGVTIDMVGWFSV